MMNRIKIRGIGVISAAGRGIDDVWNNFQNERIRPSPIDAYDTNGCRATLGFICRDEARWQLPVRKLRKFVGKKDLLAVSAAHQAVLDAGEAFNRINPQRRGCFVGASSNQIGDFVPYFPSVLRCVNAEQTNFDSNMFGRECLDDINPLAPTRVLLNGALSHISQAYGLRGANANIMDFEVSGLMALSQACRAINEGRIDSAVVVSMFDPIDPFQMAELYQGGDYLPQGNENRFLPYDVESNGYLPGQMGVALVITKETEAAFGDDVKHYPLISGVGASVGFESDDTATQADSLAKAMSLAGGDRACGAMLGCGMALRSKDRIELMAAELLAEKNREPINFGTFSPLIGMTGEAGALFDIAMTAKIFESERWPDFFAVEKPLLTTSWLSFNAPATEASKSIGILRRSKYGLNAAAIVEADGSKGGVE